MCIRDSGQTAWGADKPLTPSLSPSLSSSVNHDVLSINPDVDETALAAFLETIKSIAGPSTSVTGILDELLLLLLSSDEHSELLRTTIKALAFISSTDLDERQYGLRRGEEIHSTVLEQVRQKGSSKKGSSGISVVIPLLSCMIEVRYCLSCAPTCYSKIMICSTDTWQFHQCLQYLSLIHI